MVENSAEKLRHLLQDNDVTNDVMYVTNDVM